MKFELYKLMMPLVLIVGLSGCGGGGGGGGGGSATLPSTISWVAPTQNTDNSTLDDLAKYRFYYGPDASSLKAIPELDLVDTTGTVTSLDINTLTSQDQQILSTLVQGNTTHFFAMTAINKQNIESSFSNIVQFKP